VTEFTGVTGVTGVTEFTGVTGVTGVTEVTEFTGVTVFIFHLSPLVYPRRILGLL
jgi:hypothetical protein